MYIPVVQPSIDYFSVFLSHMSVWLFEKFTVWFIAILGKNLR